MIPKDPSYQREGTVKSDVDDSSHPSSPSHATTFDGKVPLEPAAPKGFSCEDPIMLSEDATIFEAVSPQVDYAHVSPPLQLEGGVVIEPAPKGPSTSWALDTPLTLFP